MHKYIYHIALKKDLLLAFKIGYYQADSLNSEGFLHCSTQEELINTANRIFINKRDLCLLELESAKIEAKTIYENTSGGSILYPHIYGKLNLNAIHQCYRFEPDESGKYNFPGPSDTITLK
ncbi:MAG TPA: DUF952 domain-containing protein [Bacteroidia bacterium]|nr:DUF952 domain-containing protein [Bacteroidia bacterium]